MSELKEKKQNAQRLMNRAFKYLDEEQATAIARTVAGAAAMNHMMEQVRRAEPPTLLPELAGGAV